MLDGWADANVKYMASGGFTVSTKVPNIATETLVLWGRQDKILDPKLYAQRWALKGIHQQNAGSYVCFPRGVANK